MKTTITTMIACAAFSHVQADILYDVDHNIVNFGDPAETVINDTFSLGAVSSIDSVVIELTHSWAADIDLTLAAPGGSIFDLTTDNGGSAGLGDGSSALSGVATYTFVESGGLDVETISSAGIYTAETWQSGPFAAGDWTLLLVDDADFDAGAVGNVTINGTLASVPEPSTTAFVLISSAFLLGRRKRC